MLVCEKKDADLIQKIVDRVMDISHDWNLGLCRTTVSMDLTAVHTSDCPLDLKRMLAGKDQAVMHDVLGIGSHIDRATGVLDINFAPRFGTGDCSAE